MESFVITALHIGKTLILGLWLLRVVHAKYVHYHPINDLCLAINLGMEGSRVRELVSNNIQRLYQNMLRNLLYQFEIMVAGSQDVPILVQRRVLKCPLL